MAKKISSRHINTIVILAIISRPTELLLMLYYCFTLSYPSHSVHLVSSQYINTFVIQAIISEEMLLMLDPVLLFYDVWFTQCVYPIIKWLYYMVCTFVVHCRQYYFQQVKMLCGFNTQCAIPSLNGCITLFS